MSRRRVRLQPHPESNRPFAERFTEAGATGIHPRAPTEASPVNCRGCSGDEGSENLIFASPSPGLTSMRSTSVFPTTGPAAALALMARSDSGSALVNSADAVFDTSGIKPSPRL